MFDDAVDDDAELTEESPTDKKSTKAASNKDAKDAKAAKRSEGRGLFGLRRIWLFFREVIGELRKVIWPTRNDLLTYTAVVVVFVAIMMTLVGLLDLGYAKGVLYIFGNPK
ncbi:preprotein translocase subunit SecE [Hamadaea flava]|uniref:Protein translocase subunit SecE n=1 Tax=Hamadaea flava TaxID=1742688 RepID=A0ABV8LGZ4_9ACTN|nr:preprotein translocase subunit SecE [Hamadaea flava]MCP2325640.1 preprotein translocase subunit SecE [Hamadaea flava]